MSVNTAIRAAHAHNQRRHLFANLGKKPRRRGPQRGEAAAAARKLTGLRTYRVQGETMSPARALLEDAVNDPIDEFSKRHLKHLRWMLLGCR